MTKSRTWRWPALFVCCLVPLFGDPFAPGQAEPDRLKILFIGNSITFYNEMPSIFGGLAGAAGKKAAVVQWVQGGVTLAYFAASAEAAPVISRKKWDYVVLQDGDYHIIYPGDHRQLAVPVDFLKDLIWKNNPQTKILFHELHALKKGLTHDGIHYDYAAFTQKIENGTTEFARRVDLRVAPVGQAWNEVVVNEPGIELYDPDLMHPSYAGSYLIACVYYCAVYGETCLGNSFRGKLTAEEAAVLQRTAAEFALT